MEYKDSKKVGDIAEEEILKIIQRKYPKAYIDDKGKKFGDWDIFIPEINEGIEVKTDFRCNYPEFNLLIEVEMYGKLSALSITKAKYWVIITGHRYIWITPLAIYRFLEQHPEYRRVDVTGKGDDVGKIAHLLPHDKFILYIHNNLDKRDGWIDMIKENEVLYYNNFSKSGKVIEE